MSKTISFDTSGINNVEDGGASAESVMRGLMSGFDVVLTGMVVEEIVATRNRDRRVALLSQLRWLLSEARCIQPAQEVLRRLIFEHAKNSSNFNWRNVDVRARNYEDAITRGDFDDEVSAEQRRHQFAAKKEFESVWAGLRPRLDTILRKDPSSRPGSFQDAVAMAKCGGGVFWGFGKWLYGISGKQTTEDEINAFAEMCPPFRAVCYALVLTWYRRSLRTPDGAPEAGGNDIIMAAYLPYCDRFITGDWAQANALCEIALAAGIECEVLSLRELEKSLLVAV